MNSYLKWNSKIIVLPQRITDYPGLLQDPLEIGPNTFNNDINVYHCLSKIGKLIVNIDGTGKILNMEKTEMKDNIIHNFMSTNAKHFHAHTIREDKALNFSLIHLLRVHVQVIIHLKLIALSSSLQSSDPTIFPMLAVSDCVIPFEKKFLLCSMEV